MPARFCARSLSTVASFGPHTSERPVLFYPHCSDGKTEAGLPKGTPGSWGSRVGVQGRFSWCSAPPPQVGSQT